MYMHFRRIDRKGDLNCLYCYSKNNFQTHKSNCRESQKKLGSICSQVTLCTLFPHLACKIFTILDTTLYISAYIVNILHIYHPMPFRKNRVVNFYRSDSKSHTQIHNLQFTHAMQIMLCLHICVEHVDWCRKVHQKCTLLKHDAASTCLVCTYLHSWKSILELKYLHSSYYWFLEIPCFDLVIVFNPESWKKLYKKSNFELFHWFQCLARTVNFAFKDSR